MDTLTKEQRRKAMQAVKSTDSAIENVLRKALWAKGFRYRKNHKNIFGKPDIVFVSLKIAIFCDSEFWHGYHWNKRKYDIKSNRRFWFKKIEGNILRDKKVTKYLKKDGWIVFRFWGLEIKNNLDDCLDKIEKIIKNGKQTLIK